MTQATDPAYLESLAADIEQRARDEGELYPDDDSPVIKLRNAAAEIRYWRALQVLLIQRDMRYLAASLTPETMADSYTNMLSPDLAALKEVLAGDVHLGNCECGQPIKRGDLIVTFDDVGDQHAACCGATAEQLVPGGKIPLDPASVVVEEGEQPPVDPYLAVFVADDMLDQEAIERTIAEAEAVSAAYLAAEADDEEDED